MGAPALKPLPIPPVWRRVDTAQFTLGKRPQARFDDHLRSNFWNDHFGRKDPPFHE